MAIQSTVRIAWRNLGRNRKRTALALAAIGLAQTALIFTDGLMHGYADSMLDALTGPMLGHVQVHAPEWREDRAMDLVLENADATVEELGQLPEVSSVAPRIYAPALAALGQDGHAVVAIGLDPAAEEGRGGLLAGIPADQRPREGGVLVGGALARSMGLSAGDELALVGQGADGSLANDLFTVRGVLSTPVDFVNRMGVVMSLEDAQRTFAMPDAVHEITLRGRDAEAAETLAADVAATDDLGEAEVLPWRELAPELVTIIGMTDMWGGIVLLLVFIAAAAGVANTMLMATFERKREIGMLLALGTGPGRLVRIIVVEAVLLGVLGVAIGSVIGAASVWIAAQTGFNWASMGGEAVGDLAYMGLNFQFDIFPRLEPNDFVQGLVAVVLTAILSAAWPALHAARMEPVEAMRS
jgi:ABC-type lipoprotein release transport system permease subunit